MKKLLFSALTVLFAVAIIGSCSEQTASVIDASAPHLEKNGNATQLIVDGKPWLALACELKNSSSSSSEYMESIWPELKAAGLNTVIGSASWEQVEPQEGVYDFRAVDELIEGARSQNLKLVLIWFASWKNGITSYDPIWVQKDTERFPLALTKEGRQLPILSTLGQESRNADAKAYAALMRHIREFDSQEQTVIMIQMQNEVGLHGYTRDYHPDAVKAFEGQVPSALTEYLSANFDRLIPEMREAWESHNCLKEGTWEQVFGKGDYTDELFMAWNYASYMEYVTAAGKAEYDIPVYVNAWIVQPKDIHPGDYPSGGPQAQNHDVWRAAAPSIDILSPDIYLDDYPGILRRYSRAENPVFVPESRDGYNGAANAAFTFGEMNGIGYSPFGLDSRLDVETNKPFYDFYKTLGDMTDVILKAQAEDRIAGVWLNASDPYLVKDFRIMGEWKISFELNSGGNARNSMGYAIAIDESDGRFLVLGSNVRVTFLPASGDKVVGLGKVTEGYFADGEWVERRWLNGDEIQVRYDILDAVGEGLSSQGLSFGSDMPELQKVELFKY